MYTSTGRGPNSVVTLEAVQQQLTDPCFPHPLHTFKVHIGVVPSGLGLAFCVS
jgi:hypothetical protein